LGNGLQRLAIFGEGVELLALFVAEAIAVDPFA
jgi:hypothetical protein